MDNACILGYGMVGAAMAAVFGIDKHFDVIDSKTNITLEEASKCKLIFVCLPTPVDKDGNYQVDEIKQIIKQVEEFGQGNTYVIRSTVYPGFAMALQQEMGINRIVSNPEFLSEATAEDDIRNAPFVVLGGAEGQYRKEVRAFYEGRIRSASIIETDNTTAEMAKLAMNAYFSLKVTFANQLDDGCKLVGANYGVVKKILESHPYGPTNHFTIWYKGKRGVNGHCLPKDSKAFALYAHSDLVKKMIELNENYIYLKEDDDV